MHQPKPKAIAPAPKRPRQHPETALRPQPPHLRPHPPRHVHWKPLLQHRPPRMPQQRALAHRLPPRALPLPTPGPKLELALRHDLIGHLYHDRHQKQAQSAPKVDPSAQRCVRHTDVRAGNQRREPPASRRTHGWQERAFTVTGGADLHGWLAGPRPLASNGSVAFHHHRLAATPAQDSGRPTYGHATRPTAPAPTRRRRSRSW